jgi:two-component system NarL family response regulator
MSYPIKSLIVDENGLFCKATRALLESADDITVLSFVHDGQEALDLIRETQPDVILLGVNPLRPEGLETVAQINALHPQGKIIVLSAASDQERLGLDALRKGACGYLVKRENAPAEIIEAIRTACRKGAILSPRLAGWVLDEVIQGRQKIELDTA